MQGFQLLPGFPDSRPSGLVNQQYESWILAGAPLSEVMQEQVFTDGSCMKFGAPTWNIAAWAVVKVSRDGVLLAYARGAVGRELPRTSPASENVAMLAAA